MQIAARFGEKETHDVAYRDGVQRVEEGGAMVAVVGWRAGLLQVVLENKQALGSGNPLRMSVSNVDPSLKVGNLGDRMQRIFDCLPPCTSKRSMIRFDEPKRSNAPSKRRFSGAPRLR